MTQPKCGGCGEAIARNTGNMCAVCIQEALNRRPKKALYWCGTIDTCNVCKGSFGTEMFDANVFRYGWANLCRACFTHLNCTLGTGRGQHYAKQPDGRWLKVGG